MTAQQPLRQAQLPPQSAHFVFEQLAQRLDQRQVHPLRQAADVVVRLDGDAGAAVERHGLDDVRVEGALRQEVGAAVRQRLLLEDIDEGGADRLALRLGVDTPASLPRNSSAASRCTSGC